MTGPRGTICSVGLATSDPSRAKSFYARLFGWHWYDVQVGDGGEYSTLRHEGREVGILYRQTPEAQAARVAPHWTPYLLVEDADASALRARELGGTLVREPQDVGTAGRVAGVQDPLGGLTSLWQPYKHGGEEPVGAVGALCWYELVTSDVDRTKTFYGGLLGWEYEAGPDTFTTVLNHGTPVATIRDVADRERGMADWIPYFGVERVDEAEHTAELSGARILRAGAFSLIGWSALIADPLGASFAVLEHPVRA